MSKFFKKFGAALVLAAMLGGCKEEMPSLGTASSEGTSSEAAEEASPAVTTVVPAKEDKETGTVTSEKSENYQLAERTVLKNHIKQAAGDDETIGTAFFGDFDGDGSEELVALCGHTWWYTNGRKTGSLRKSSRYHASILDAGEQKVVVFIDSYTTTVVKRAYLFAFKDGEVTELDGSGQFESIEKIGDNIFEVSAYAHDESFGSGERTKKTYHLYFEDGQFKDFVGEKITKADFMKYSGGKTALDGIEAEGGTVTEILRRENGIVNVNYTVDEDGTAHNKYRTYDVSGGSCRETASGNGICLPSVLNPYSEEQLALHKLIIEASEAEGDIINPLFGDFDGDGINEVIAVLGKYDDDEVYQIDGSRGEVWFASGDKAYKLLDHFSMGPWGRPYLLRSGGRTLVNIWGTNPGPMGGVSSVTHNYLIKNSEVTKIDNYGIVTNCYGGFGDFFGSITGADMYFTCNDRENTIYGLGTTYIDYWFYLSDDTFSEYYGTEITEEEFLKYDGAQAVLDKITADGYTADKIFKRGNGIINVNYSHRSETDEDGDYEISNRNITLTYRNGKVAATEFGYNDGINEGVYYECADSSKTEPTDFERFSEMIYDTAEGDENSFIRERFCGDCDNDGKNELYAYYGTDESFSLWLADESGAKKVTENISLFYADGDVLMKNGDDYFVIKNGKSQKLDTMGAEEFSMQADGSFTGYVSAGHTDSTRSEEARKLYWFRYKDGKISDYTGTDITEEELLQYGGGRAALDEISARGGDLVNIVRRANGIINVNYALHNQTTTKRFFMTLQIDADNKLTDITPKKEDGTPDNAGWYLHSLNN